MGNITKGLATLEDSVDRREDRRSRVEIVKSHFGSSTIVLEETNEGIGEIFGGVGVCI